MASDKVISTAFLNLKFRLQYRKLFLISIIKMNYLYFPFVCLLGLLIKYIVMNISTIFNEIC